MEPSGQNTDIGISKGLIRFDKSSAAMLIIGLLIPSIKKNLRQYSDIDKESFAKDKIGAVEKYIDQYFSYRPVVKKAWDASPYAGNTKLLAKKLMQDV